MRGRKTARFFKPLNSLVLLRVTDLKLGQSPGLNARIHYREFRLVFGRVLPVFSFVEIPDMPAIFVGIDVARTNLDVCILPVHQTFRLDNNKTAHRKLVQQLQTLAEKPSDIPAVLESTGGFELPLALALEEAGFEVAITKPDRSRYFAKATGQLAKTNAIDAGILALFCQKVPLTIVALPAEDIRNFRDLLDRREQLMGI